MNWSQQIDAYCERLGPGGWAEPVNALTNICFLLAAAVMWRRTEGLARGMAAVLAAIGVGSFLFHSFATAWASLADTAPILGFILLYLYAANRHFLGLTQWRAIGLSALFVPYAAALVPLFAMVPGLGSSAAYAPVPVLIFIYASLLARRAPQTARGMAGAGALLVLSLGFRTLDGPLCTVWPLGTHFVWHILNAAMLGWMIEVFHRHTARPLAARAARG